MMQMFEYLFFELFYFYLFVVFISEVTKQSRPRVYPAMNSSSQNIQKISYTFTSTCYAWPSCVSSARTSYEISSDTSDTGVALGWSAPPNPCAIAAFGFLANVFLHM